MQLELDGILTPAILGGSYRAAHLALRLYIACGVKSHIYARSFSPLCYLFGFIKRHRITYTSDDILLLDLHSLAEANDSTLLYLFPTDNEFEDFTKTFSGELENDFVTAHDICDIELSTKQ